MIVIYFFLDANTDVTRARRWLLARASGLLLLQRMSFVLVIVQIVDVS